MKILNIIKTFGAIFALIFALGSSSLNMANAQVWCNDGSYAATPEGCYGGGGGGLTPSWNEPCYGYNCMNTGVWCNDGSYAATAAACPQYNYNQGVWCNDGSYAATAAACPQYNYNQCV
ncbi:MAG: hypothetical protein VB008_02150, partial [Candidatus Elulimicrobiales bacterium]|nr:hypothetical protein [Candidatus Elulimicrobiales bacterium]